MIEDTLEEISRQLRENRLFQYLPYGHPDTLCPDGKVFEERAKAGDWVEWSNKPWQLDFHNAGKKNQERLLLAANRPGKTYSAANEVAFHLTGLYPGWWDGKVFDHPVLTWTGSPTNEMSRDIVQKELLGGTGQDLGTGSVPKSTLVGRPKFKQAGISDVVDLFRVRHSSGGTSVCVLKTYEQGWRKWQGTAPHVVWMDEEPEDYKIYTEALTRLLTSHGIMLATLTPLLGQTDLVRSYQEGVGDGVYIETATWDDAPHLDEAERERLLSRYPIHERKTRTRGVPMMGEGAVFPIDEEDIKYDPSIFPDGIPPHFARIKGIDFGIAVGHPGAGACVAHDRDQDVLYVYRTYRKEGETSVYHARAINGNDPWVPIAWPHDGLNREKAGGKVLHEAYREEGASMMLGISARYDNKTGGSQPVEPIVVEILERMQTGRFKVASTCHEFFDEMRSYHRKDGKIIAKRDDTLKAVFYAVMMLRYALPMTRPRVHQPYSQAVVSA